MLKTLVLLSLFFIGCVHTQTKKVTLKNDFDPLLTAKLIADGKNTIKGNAFFPQANGGVVTCAGRSIFLFPVTDYSKERINVIYGNDQKGYSPHDTNFVFTNDNPEFKKHVKESICDSAGNFEFINVAPGDYFISTTIVWAVTQYRNSGGAIMKRISVKSDIDRLILSP